MNCTLPYPEPVDAFVFVINSHVIRGAVKELLTHLLEARRPPVGTDL